MPDIDGQVEELNADVTSLAVAVSEVRVLEPPRPPVAQPAVQVAAVAATGLVAGAATIAVLRRRARRPPAARRRTKRQGGVQVLASRSFLVDIHLIDRA